MNRFERFKAGCPDSEDWQYSAWLSEQKHAFFRAWVEAGRPFIQGYPRQKLPTDLRQIGNDVVEFDYWLEHGLLRPEEQA